MKRHPEPLRLTLLSAFCHLRTRELIDTLHRPVLDALAIVKKYAGSRVQMYPPDEFVPTVGIVRGPWQETVLERDSDGTERVNRLAYEVCVLLALRERPRSKEVWVEGADRYPLPVQPEPENLAALKARMLEHWPLTSLLDVFKEADLRIGFTGVFRSATAWENLDRNLVQERLLLTLYGLGSNAGIKRMSAGQARTNYKDLLYVRRRYVTKDQLRAAIREVVNATLTERSPAIWGEGTTACASDWDQNLTTEWHARYGGRGVMIYWHVDRKSTCIYSQLKRCSSSEVAAMVEGVLHHCTDMTVERQYTDSHGQSEVAFAFCKLLGFELLPRLKAIHSQRLYRPDNTVVYPNLAPVISRTIDWNLIAQQYGQLVKYATALRLGTADTEDILRRFNRTTVQHPVYRALSELGAVVKTIFLCRYLHSVVFLIM